MTLSSLVPLEKTVASWEPYIRIIPDHPKSCELKGLESNFPSNPHHGIMSAKPADATRPRPAGDTKKVHIADTALTRQNWYKHVNWLNVTFIIGIPLYGCIQALWVPLQVKTAVWAVIYYFFTGLGITAGRLS